MIKKIMLIAILASALICAVAFTSYAETNDWTGTDTALEMTYLTLRVIDWRQTLNIVKHPDLYEERNSFLGPHPARVEVNFYMAVCAIGHVTIASLLPHGPWRTGFQALTIIEVGNAVNNNRRLGLGMTIGF